MTICFREAGRTVTTRFRQKGRPVTARFRDGTHHHHPGRRPVALDSHNMDRPMTSPSSAAPTIPLPQEAGGLRRPVASRAAMATAAVLLCSSAACAPAAEGPVLAVTNVTVVDAAQGARPGQTVVVDGDRIVAVGTGVDVPRGARVVDGTDRYLIPGLWDMHVHLTYDQALVEAMPRLFLSYGVTSVRDTGGLLDELLPVVRTMRAEGAVAPRVFFSGPLLDGAFVVYDGDGRPEIGTANPSPQAARANVASLAAAGVDFIKIYEMVTPEVFDALVAAGNEHGLPIAMHVPLSLQAGQTASRVRSMEHLRNVEMDCAANAGELLETRRRILAEHREGPGAELRSRLHGLQRLPAVAAYDAGRCDEVLASMRNTIQVPTLRLNALAVQGPFDRPDWSEALDRLPAEVATNWRAATERRLAAGAGNTTFGEWSLALIGWMHERGVPIGAGTDTPISFAAPGHSLHDELDMLVRAGLSPVEALRSATVRPAEFFGLEGQMGQVAEGYRADLVLLGANPLEDISHSRRIEGVVSRGRWFTVEELRDP